MDKLGPAIIILIIVSVIFLGMWLAWRSRVRKSCDVLIEPAAGVDLGTVKAQTDALYVATTEHGKPFERLAISGLEFRGKATITVATAGVVIAIVGEPEVLVPTSAICEVSNATVTIDRVVERDGLVKVAWRVKRTHATTNSSTSMVDSYFRTVSADDGADLIAAVSSILPVATATDNCNESEV